MIYDNRVWLLALLLILGVLPLLAGDLKNPGFEEAGGWQVVRKGRDLQTDFDALTFREGKRSFSVSLPWATPTNDGDFAGVAQDLELTAADKGISFSVKDDYTGGTARYHWMELLLDEDIIWEADVAGGDLEWRTVSLDLIRYLEKPKRKQIGRNQYREDPNYRITFRLRERKGVTRFGVQVWVDGFKLLRESPADPQNCEKKKTSPVLRDLLVYYDEADLFQPITKLEHLARKRQQIIDGMLAAMGSLPGRPRRTGLEDFNIRVVDSRVRGRYTKKTIVLDAAEGEVIHAFLYEPLEKRPGEKRPGIVGMHPTGEHGKGSFESWPLCNFPIELAMMGYVVIVPDYPGFGDSRPYDFAGDRYDSGTIKGVFNHLTCVDLLQCPIRPPSRLSPPLG